MRYTDIAAAKAAGFDFVHEPEQSRFALHSPDGVQGVAEYTVRGDVIDFDHTEVDPSLRGTGIAELLGNYALRSDFANQYTLAASCRFIVGLAEKTGIELKQ